MTAADMFRFSALITIGLLVKCAFASEWAYRGPHGVNHWSELEGSQCGTGPYQSPIDIDTADVEMVDFEEFKLDGYDLGDEDPGREVMLADNGHTLIIDLKGNYHLSGGGLPGNYRAIQFHFHWGSTDAEGSEHTIDQHRYSAEMHIVHINSDRFDSFSDALASGDRDAIAVLGYFLEVRKRPNKQFQEIFNLAKLVGYDGEEQSLADHPFSLSKLLPSDHSHFYRYNGSLTTPPCSEEVIWTIFQKTIKVSEDQLEVLRHLHQGTREDPGGFIVNNFRQPQPLNGRVVQYNGNSSQPRHRRDILS